MTFLLVLYILKIEDKVINEYFVQLIMEAIEKEQHVCTKYVLISIFLIYLNEIIPTSTFAGIIFVDKSIFLFSSNKENQTAIKRQSRL